MLSGFFPERSMCSTSSVFCALSAITLTMLSAQGLENAEGMRQPFRNLHQKWEKHESQETSENKEAKVRCKIDRMYRICLLPCLNSRQEAVLLILWVRWRGILFILTSMVSSGDFKVWNICTTSFMEHRITQSSTLSPPSRGWMQLRGRRVQEMACEEYEYR